MTSTDPVLLVFFLGALAAGAAALGALPFVGERRPSVAWIGAAYATAGGAMLGAGYLLMSHGLELATWSVVLGAAGGVAYTRWVQSYAHLETVDEAGAPDEGYKIILRDTLHAAAEGLAIGVAMALELHLGVFLALALAVHNVGEGMALADNLCGRGMRVREAAGLAVVTNVTQPLLAIVGFALSPAVGFLFPALIGFAAGALVFLTLTELVPASYRRADHRLVAFLVSAAAGAVVLFESVFVEGLR